MQVTFTGFSNFNIGKDTGKLIPRKEIVKWATKAIEFSVDNKGTKDLDELNKMGFFEMFPSEAKDSSLRLEYYKDNDRFSNHNSFSINGKEIQDDDVKALDSEEKVNKLFKMLKKWIKNNKESMQKTNNYEEIQKTVNSLYYGYTKGINPLMWLETPKRGSKAPSSLNRPYDQFKSYTDLLKVDLPKDKRVTTFSYSNEKRFFHS